MRLKRLIKKYYPNGNLKSQTEKFLWWKHGKYEKWYENGFLHKKGQYSCGISIGIWKYWKIDGSFAYSINSPKKSNIVWKEKAYDDGIYETDFKAEQQHPIGIDYMAQRGEKTCSICLTNIPNISGVCGHLCCCIECSKKLYKERGLCPICRKEWEDLRLVYV